MKRFIIKKVIFAKNIRAAAKEEKLAEIVNIYLDEEVTENMQQAPMGFRK